MDIGEGFRDYERLVLQPADYPILKQPVDAFVSVDPKGFYVVVPELYEYGYGSTVEEAVSDVFGCVRTFYAFLIHNEGRLGPQLARGLAKFREVLV